MKKLLFILLLFVSFGAIAQTYDTLPPGSKPYGNQLYITPTGLIIGGTGSAKFRVLGTKKYVDSLLALKQDVSAMSAYVTKTGTETLTNKTLTAPVINTPDITNGIANSMTLVNGTINNTPIGASIANTGRFTTLTATVAANVPDLPTTDSTSKAANTKFIKQLVTFVTPEEFGAVGNGVTNDGSALQSAINTGRPVYLSKTYLAYNIQLPNNAYIFGGGKLTNNTNNPTIKIFGSNVKIDGLTFIGSGKNSGNTLQNAIENKSSNQSILVNNCIFYGIGGAAVYSSSSGPEKLVFGISNVFIRSSYYGFKFENQGEYNNVVNASVDSAKVGFYNKAGNNSISGGQIVHCDTNVYIGGGTNNGHDFITNTKINHGVNYNIYIDGVTVNYTFSNCPIYIGNISINNSTGIKFIGCEIGLEDYTLSVNNSVFTEFFGNKFYTFGGYSNSGDKPLFIENTWQQQQPPSSIIDRTSLSKKTVSQNFGVGTTDPDIFGRGYDKILGVSSSGQSGFQVNSGTGNVFFDLGVGGVRTFNVTSSGTESYFTNLLNSPLYIGVNNSTQLAVTTTGLGIKNFSPSEALDVTGKALVSGAPTVPTGVVRKLELDSKLDTSFASHLSGNITGTLSLTGGLLRQLADTSAWGMVAYWDGSGYLTYSTIPDILGYVPAKVANTSASAPTPTGTGTKGDVIVTGGYRYECINTNTWVRSAIETTW